jgi:hypothetical protein
MLGYGDLLLLLGSAAVVRAPHQLHTRALTLACA